MAPEKYTRKSFLGGLLQRSRTADTTTHPILPKYSRTNTAPDTPTQLRLPSATPAVASASTRSRRTTLSTAPPSAPSHAAAPAAASKETRSPGARRPPASHSTGYDPSRGPTVTLVTRGTADSVRRPSQQPSQQQADPSSGPVGAVSPGGPPGTSRRRRDEPDAKSLRPQQTKPSPLRRRSTSSSRPASHMAASPSSTASSDYDSGLSSQPQSHATLTASTRPTTTSHEPAEDLFMNIAEDSAPKPRVVDTAARERLRSRIARVNNRSSFPSGLHSPSPVHSNASLTPTPSLSRLPYVDTNAATQPRRTSLLPTTTRHSTTTLDTPRTRLPELASKASTTIDTPRTRLPELTSKASFSSRKDAQLSPHEFLAQFGKKPPAQADTQYTPSNRTSTYRPSNLNYSSSRDDPTTPQADAFDTGSRADGTESLASTGPAVSVWDELDELKTRIRRIEMGGKIPATSGAIISQATADRPRTANTSTTLSSVSPSQARKSNPSSSGSTTDTQTTNKTHPLLREALAKVRQHAAPDVYRRLEATAAEALALAELTGSAGPQGTLHSTSSVAGGAVVPDRQVRRKADNICRGLTELCIALCDTKPSILSPSVRSSTIAPSRRPSLQVNGESPPVRQSVEPESNQPAGVSPSRALTRIEARRTSMLANGSLRESVHELDHAESRTFSRQQRTGSSHHRTRQSVDDDEEDDPTIRAPSRALTDFRTIRAVEKTTTSRLPSRQYTSQEPMPGLQPSPTIQPTSSLRRPTATGMHSENSLLFRDSRRYNVDRESSPAYEKPMANNLQARPQFSTSRNLDRNSIGTINDLGRSMSISGRRLRGASTGE